MSTLRPFVILVLLLTAGCLRPDDPTPAEQVAALGEIDFNFHIRPILSQNCYTCHGPDAGSREADLRLDTPEGAYAPRDSGFAIVPGDPAGSQVMFRLTAADPEERMPPADSHYELTPVQIETIRAWIAQGAVYKPHWAFIPPVKPEPPAVAGVAPANPIDAFVRARLDREGLKPAPEADPRTLIRRLSYDLTGLPPTPEAVHDFLADTRPDAYERLVDRLLASPRFGERMAVHWLDLARYADTNGYSIDGGRHMWVWRDWVIKSFNDNLPFDDFVRQQLAGDLLPEATEAQLIATGFNRNHMITHEGGTIPEENLTNYVVDRVKTTGEVFLGLTVACAQCHDHKYDPISQRDYYRLFAYFNTLDDQGLDGNSGVNARPTIMASTPLVDTREIERLRVTLDSLHALEATDHPAQPAWEDDERRHLAERGRGFGLIPLEPIKITTPNSGNTGSILPDSSLLIDQPGGMAAYNVSLRADTAEPITGLRVVFYPDAVTRGYIGHGRRDDMQGSLVVSSLTVSNGELPSDQVDLYRTIPLRSATASFAHPDFPAKWVLDEEPLNGWSPNPANRTAQHLTVRFQQPVDAGATPYLTAMLNFGIGSNLIAGRFRIFAITGVDDDTNLPAGIQTLLATAPAERTAEQQSQLRAYFYAEAPQAGLHRYAMQNAAQRIDALEHPQPTMVMNTAATPRETFILNRGQYDQPQDAVEPGTPAFLPGLEEGPPGRLGLAEWLLQPDHPLTARVAVNRFWQLFFGRGIVATAADFGSQGALPTHPELLDWLAVSFVDSGWDVKNLVRQIVTSDAYRQDSGVSEAARRRDPENRLLARGPRFRLQAEFIRDTALMLGGLMNGQIGGPSVKPYQPAGLWKEVSHYGSSPATAQVFVQDHGEKLYRRSMYTYWKRTLPPPSMVTFDAPNREMCTVTREVTNTPLQALVLLNDPQFVEASRAFGQRIALAPGDVDARLALAFEMATSRLPNREELAILKHRFEEELAAYRNAPADAEALLSIGESPRDRALDAPEHAAWTTVASLILNLSETVTKG
ncbi:MAG: PSD1 and planctomycete cytochrome C domain-containing protein [Rhodothermales bacterium]